jgi:hypothetical protein
MTILANLILLVGICLVADGAFNRGVLLTILPGMATSAASTIRIAEVVTGGMVFVFLGLGLSTC